MWTKKGREIGKICISQIFLGRRVPCSWVISAFDRQMVYPEILCLTSKAIIMKICDVLMHVNPYTDQRDSVPFLSSPAIVQTKQKDLKCFIECTDWTAFSDFIW